MESTYYMKFYVKITGGPMAGGNGCIYFNTDFTFEQFTKWMWYFQYRAALFKVNNPKWYIHLETGSFHYSPPKQMLIKKLNDKIIGKKAAITKNENLIKLAKEKWNQLFPIEEEPEYMKALVKTEELKIELEKLEREIIKLKA